MTLDVPARHRLASLLSRALPGEDRFARACTTAGRSAPPRRGTEPVFAAVTAWLLAGPDSAQVEALVEDAARSAPPLADALRAAAGRTPEPDPDQLATVRVLGPAQQASSDLPRPPGIPAEAPPRGGASSWLLRRVHLSVPTSVRGGQDFEVRTTLSLPGRGSVPGAPEDAAPYEGPPVVVDYELWLEEAEAATGATGEVEVAPDAERVEFAVTLRASSPLSEGVDVVARFFLGGYEVGRARAFIPDADRDDVEPRPASPGALAVPDSILS